MLGGPGGPNDVCGQQFEVASASSPLTSFCSHLVTSIQGRARMSPLLLRHGLWSRSRRRSPTQTETTNIWRAGALSTLCYPLTLRRQDQTGDSHQTPGRRHTIQEDTRSRERVLTATRVGEQAMSFGSEIPNMRPRVNQGWVFPPTQTLNQDKTHLIHLLNTKNQNQNQKNPTKQSN